jgi:hypothetical protein
MALRFLSRTGVERPVSQVPRGIIAALALALAAQIAWHGRRPDPFAHARALPVPPSVATLRSLSFGEEPALARFLMLWLQAFDHQPGVSIPYRELDYGRVTEWLDRILALDPRSRYPLLSAARIYGDVPDEGRRRVMIDFVERQFLLDPASRWPWLAHSIFMARHRLNDLPLALRLARELRVHTRPDQAPGWARQMELFVLEAMGETESAKVLLGGLIESGQLPDPAERRFLLQRLGE